MLVALWITVGLAVGVVAALTTSSSRRGSALLVASSLGVFGAVLGGFAGRAIGLYRLIVSSPAIVSAVVGAVLVLALYNAAFAPRSVRPS